MIKRLLFFGILLFLKTFIPCTFAQNEKTLFDFILHGKIYDDSTGAPITSHEVTVSTDQGYTHVVYSGIDGNYGDTITGLTDPQLVIHVATRDCHNDLHTQSAIAGNLIEIVNFGICGNNNPPPGRNIGGLLFAGDFPINNPQPTGDTGVALLYQAAGQELILRQTDFFTDYGYFKFLHVVPGNYKIKLALTPGSAHFNDFVPVWYGDEIRWNYSEQVQIAGEDIFNLDVHLTPVKELNSGISEVGGTVILNDNDNGYRDEEVEDAEVILYNADGEPVDYLFTCENGEFTFDRLPYGTYSLYAEYTGKYSRFITFSVSEAVPSVHDLKLELYPHSVEGISENAAGGFVNVYPNPADEILNIRINSEESAVYQLRIFDVNGTEEYYGKEIVKAGESIIRLDVSQLSQGIHMFMLNDEKGNPSAQGKFIRRTR